MSSHGEAPAAHRPTSLLHRALWTPLPVKVIARALGLMTLGIALAAVIWSFGIEAAASPAPDYALASTFLYRLERAVLATVLFAFPAAFVAQLLAGQLPRRIGRVGVEWQESAVDGGAQMKSEQAGRCATFAPMDPKSQRVANELVEAG